MSLAHYENLFQLHVFNSNTYLHYFIERQSTVVCHLSVGVTFQTLVLKVL